MHKIGILLPVYINDRLIYFEKAITSILHQTCTDIDIIICKDGPIAGEIDLFIQGIKERNVVVVEEQVNTGLAAILNKGLQYCLSRDYEFIGRMDADDVSDLRRFEKQMKFLRENPDIDCVGTWAAEVDELDNVIFYKKMPVRHEECYKFFMKRDLLVHATALFRREFFLKAGLYPTTTFFAEDTLLWANGLKNNCRFANIPEYLYQFRIDHDFFSRRRGIRHAFNLLRLRFRINKYLHYPWVAYLYAAAYSIIKLMPGTLIKTAYNKLR